jgi:hypothetical protein
VASKNSPAGAPMVSKPASTTIGLSVVAAVVAVVLAIGLLVADAIPGALGSEAHALVSALPLALVALAYMLHQPSRRPSVGQAVKAGLLCAAFLLWAAAQVRPSLPVAVNDAAIALFVTDLALIVGSDLLRAAEK